MADTFIHLVSVSWNNAAISFSLPVMSIVEIESLKPTQKVLATTTEENLIGRICIENLLPETEYKIIVKWESGHQLLTFTTLPKPIGQCTCKFLAIADTHISEKNENRKGRLFVESSMILSDIAKYANSEKIDFIVIAGDITNMSKESEYNQAKKILSEFECPYYLVPGDHDVLNKGGFLWRETFGQAQWIKDYKLSCGKKIRLIGIDTSNRKLGKSNLDWLKQNIADDRLNIIISHFQLIPDDYIKGPNRKIIEDYDEFRSEIEQLCNFETIIYVGHQNIPSRKFSGNTLQVNLPQPVQFPCGCFEVRIYENGVYHRFMPITSEILNEYSRKFSELASSHLQESHWKANYRIGKSVYESNFIFYSSLLEHTHIKK